MKSLSTLHKLSYAF